MKEDVGMSKVCELWNAKCDKNKRSSYLTYECSCERFSERSLERFSERFL